MKMTTYQLHVHYNAHAQRGPAWTGVIPVTEFSMKVRGKSLVVEYTAVKGDDPAICMDTPEQGDSYKLVDDKGEAVLELKLKLAPRP